MADERLIGMYHKVRGRDIYPRVRVYVYGNVAICRDLAGKPVSNDKALETLAGQLETHERLRRVKVALN